MELHPACEYLAVYIAFQNFKKKTTQNHSTLYKKEKDIKRDICTRKYKRHRKNKDSQTLARQPYLLKQALKDMALLIPSHLVPVLHHDARHGLDAHGILRRLGHGIEPRAGLVVVQPGPHHRLRDARGHAHGHQEGVVAEVAAVLKVALEQLLDNGGLALGAELTQGDGAEAVGGAGVAGDAADGEGDVVLCAGDLDAGEEVWVEGLEAVVDAALFDAVCEWLVYVSNLLVVVVSHWRDGGSD